MTEILEVRVNKAKVAEWRAGERRGMLASAIVSIIIGVPLVGTAVAFGIGFAQGAPEGLQWAWAVVAAEFLAGLYQFWVARRKFREIAAKAAYWDSDDLPDVAFRLDTAGIELRDPADDQPIRVPWAEVRSFGSGPLMVNFRVQRGVLPARYRNRIQFGLAVLDTPLDTIRVATRELSGGSVG